MKNKVKTYVLLAIVINVFIAFTSCNRTTPSTMKINVNGIAEGSSVQLLFGNYGRKIYDTVEVFSNQTLEYERNWKSPQVIKVRVGFSEASSFLSLSCPMNLQLDLENNIISNLKVEYEGLPAVEDTKTRLQMDDSIDLSGFSFDERTLVEYIQYDEIMTSYKELYTDLYAQWNELRKEYGDEIIPQEARKPLDEAFNKFYGDVSEYKTNYVKSNNNFVTEYIMVTDLNLGLELEEFERILDKTPEQLLSGPYFKILKDRLDVMKSLQIGAVAPDFTIPDANGNEITLSSLRGNYVLLDFWASWCGYCRKENPIIKEAYARFGVQNKKLEGSKLDIIYVSLDDSKEKWLEAIKEDDLPWHHVSSLKGWGDPIVKTYDINGVPSPFLLDPDGKIVAKGDVLRGENLLLVLDKFLNKK